MIILSVRVQNFRSVLDETLTCDMLTALVGRNGSGKSTFLYALNLFYDQSLKPAEEDYYNRNTLNPVVIAVTFKVLSAEAREQFARYMQADTLTVERVFEWNAGKPSGTYHGSSLQKTEFKEVREAGGAREQRPKYDAIRDDYGLPKWSNQDAALQAMASWEEDNPGLCQRHRDDGRFFGFTSVGTGYLGKCTRFLFVPAVKEASDDAREGRGTVFSLLMDLVVRSVLASREAYKKLKEETQARYEEIMNPENLPELSNLGDSITKTLQSFVPDSRLALKWRDLTEVDIPMPQADAKLIEDEFEADVGRTGHGLQRAFILAMLQHLALAQTIARDVSPRGDEVKVKVPCFVLAVEEPELYQHPSRQRHFADVLHRLASGSIPGVSQRTQIVYATHSPLFVGIDRIEQIRLLRKCSNEAGLPKTTSVVRVCLDDLAERLWKANGEHGNKYGGDTLLPRLKTTMTPWMN
ncbi:MAG: AAA family ATPase, partial [Candidatus Sumerlaeota bacterium]|nr:AAA family ATPase [Candidatus Sumerlaeota bacterium]